MEKPHICDFLIGVSMGAAIGLLWAPYSGKKLRGRITEAATSGVAYAKDRGETVSDVVSGVIADITRRKEGLAEAIKRGTYTYKRAVS